VEICRPRFSEPSCLRTVKQSHSYSIKAIQKYTFGVSRADFMASSEKQDAVIRRLEVIGEAANRLADDFRSHYPEIPWSGIVGLRNVLIHYLL
jgi:uncharacterized protein with HEPN domain